MSIHSGLSATLAGVELSLKEAALRAGGSYAETRLKRPPYHWIKQSEDLGQQNLELACIHDVCIVDVFNIYIPSIAAFVTEMSYPNSLTQWRIPHSRKNGTLQLLTEKPLKEIRDPVFLIGGHNNHYHWVLNWLPRLLALRRLGGKLARMENLKFAVHYGITPTHLEMLRECGIEDRNILMLRPDVYRYALKKAIIPNFFSSHCYYRDVGDFLHNLVSAVPRGPYWGIYISRNNVKVPRRRIRNEDAILDVCSLFGVKKIVLEEMSFHEQVSAFRGAKAIIAAHGAGLANLVFADRGADLLIFESKKISEFVELALLCDVRCTVSAPEQFIDTAKEREISNFEPRNRDIIVDTKVVYDFLFELKQRRGLPLPPRSDGSADA